MGAFMFESSKNKLWNKAKDILTICFSSFRNLYWIDGGLNPKIEKSMLNGSSRIALVDTDLVRPVGLALDSSSLYWCDQQKKVIEKVCPSVMFKLLVK